MIHLWPIWNNVFGQDYRNAFFFSSKKVMVYRMKALLSHKAVTLTQDFIHSVYILLLVAKAYLYMNINWIPPLTYIYWVQYCLMGYNVHLLVNYIQFTEQGEFILFYFSFNDVFIDVMHAFHDSSIFTLISHLSWIIGLNIVYFCNSSLCSVPVKVYVYWVLD
jgi:hypothetical protein